MTNCNLQNCSNCQENDCIFCMYDITPAMRNADKAPEEA